MNKKIIFAWLHRLIAVLFMGQSLFFKFSGAEESVYIFSTLGIEPWGRIGTGVAELIACLLILITATTGVGALLGMGIMAGALLSHLFVLGIAVKGDNGQLFIYALLVFVSCAILVFIFKTQLLQLIKKQSKPQTSL